MTFNITIYLFKFIILIICIFIFFFFCLISFSSIIVFFFSCFKYLEIFFILPEKISFELKSLSKKLLFLDLSLIILLLLSSSTVFKLLFELIYLLSNKFLKLLEVFDVISFFDFVNFSGVLSFVSIVFKPSALKIFEFGFDFLSSIISDSVCL